MKRVSITQPITSSVTTTGKANISQPANEISTPNSSFTIAARIMFGGVPMSVPKPPMVPP